MGCFDTTWRVLTRRKKLDSSSGQESQLRRVLTTFDLTALGVGSTLGVGVYVIAGKVARETAGPAVILSFLIAAIASVFAGLCYAEFGSRAPKAGSAYIYSYVSVGEFIAFVIGWNLILEYVIGSASVARGLSGYLDTLLNDTMEHAFIDIAPINVSFLAKYFDFFAFGISVLLAIALAFGMKESSTVNNFVTTLNIGVVLFSVIAGSIKADFTNWEIQPNATNTTGENIGDGGFFPFGIEGVIKGAATCFYGFVGFDCIATTGEEVKNPKRAIPFSILLSLLIIFLSYFGTSMVVTLMVPYYAQDIDVPIPHAFEMVGWEWAKWVVAIGGIFGLCASLFGAMFPLPRIIYAMASDSLIFKFLGSVNERFQSPLIGTILSGILTGLMAALFDLKQLVDMMSIGTLMAYTIVAASVLLLRYENDFKSQYALVQTSSDVEDDLYTDNRAFANSEDTDLLSDDALGITCCNFIMQCCPFRRSSYPTKLSEKVATTLVFLYCIFCIFIGLCVMFCKEELAKGEVWAITLTSVAVGLAVLSIIFLALQPKSQKQLSFKVPLVPLIPALSILVNIYLMLMLDKMTWIRFGVWMAIGLPIYYFSLSPIDIKNKTSIQKIYEKHKTLNGCDNLAFETMVKQNNPKNMSKKKTRAPLPPPHNNQPSQKSTTNGSESNGTIRTKQDFALQALDDVIANHETKTPFNNIENVNVAYSSVSPVSSNNSKSLQNVANVCDENVINIDSDNHIGSNIENKVNDDVSDKVDELGVSDNIHNDVLEEISLAENVINDSKQNKSNTEDILEHNDSHLIIETSAIVKESNENFVTDHTSGEIVVENIDTEVHSNQDVDPIIEAPLVVTEPADDSIQHPFVKLRPVKTESIVKEPNSPELIKHNLRPITMHTIIKAPVVNQQILPKSQSFVNSKPKPIKPKKTQYNKSLNDIKLKPVRRQSLEEIRRDSASSTNAKDANIPTPPKPPPVTLQKELNNNASQINVPPPPNLPIINNTNLFEEKIQDYKSNKKEDIAKGERPPNRPTSFQLKNVKLKPSSNKNNELKPSKEPALQQNHFRPTMAQLKDVKLRSPPNQQEITDENNSVEEKEPDVSGVIQEQAINKSKKYINFRSNLERTLLSKPSNSFKQTDSVPPPITSRPLSAVDLDHIREGVLDDPIDRNTATKNLSDLLHKRMN